MPGQNMTDYLYQEESKKKTLSDADRADLLTSEPDLIEPDANGVYQIWPIECFTDCVAIAPMPSGGLTPGGIALPTSENKDTGIVIGKPVTTSEFHYPVVGQVVSFSSRSPVANLSGKFPQYGNTKILVVRVGSVFAALPQVPTNINVETGSISA